MEYNPTIKAALVLLVALSGCTEASKPYAALTPPSADVTNNKIGVQMKLKAAIPDRNALLADDQIPAISKMSDEQRDYVIEILAATKRVIEGRTSLEKEEKETLGEGQYFWPKDPAAPVKRLKSFLPENFRMKGISLSFGRVAEGLRWNSANLFIHPRNFPNGVYQMNLPEGTFADYKLEKAELSLRADEPVKRVNVFQYINKNDNSIKMVIETHEDVASLKEMYPSSFHAIQFQKMN